MYEITFFALAKATWETLLMVFFAGIISIFFGLILGCFLFIYSRHTIAENKFVYRCLGFIVNMVRSLPFIILMILLIPLTRLLMGTTIGTAAAIVPLTIAAIPFFARITETALAEVPAGLTEAGQAMGATTWQLVTKILLPESLPSLIKGGTLTLIGLIGYSAMAGVIGGGGLGELAINYGYQRFNIVVMLETVVVLILLVQLIQMLGDQLARQRRLKPLLVSSAVIVLFFALTLWATFASEKHDSLRVGVMAGWSEEVMQVAAQIAEKDYGLKLEIIPFTDYIQPNTALETHSIDANIFQHLPYLQAQIKAHHYHLVPIGKTFVYPMGFYSEKIKNISQLPYRALVAIPNDPSNSSRSLLLLEKYGLIKLKPGVGVLATTQDIISNPYHLQFKLLDAAQLPRSLADADLVAITNDFLSQSHLLLKQALLKEDSQSLYANIIVVHADEQHNPLLQELVAVMHSPQVIAETERIFPDGAAIPAK